MAVLGLLLTSLFVSVVEAYSCPDCDPIRTFAASNGAVAPSLGGDSGQGEQHHSAGTCPVCFAAPLAASSTIHIFLVSAHDVVQDRFLSFSSIDNPIYKPPRIAS
jgi:hypothetical protein